MEPQIQPRQSYRQPPDLTHWAQHLSWCRIIRKGYSEMEQSRPTEWPDIESDECTCGLADARGRQIVGHRTWDDLVLRAADDPILHQLTHVIEHTGMSREDILIETVIEQSRMNAHLRKALLDAINTRPVSFVIPVNNDHEDDGA